MKNRIYIYIIVLIISSLSISGCSDSNTQKPKVGLSQCALDTQWRLNMNRRLLANAMQQEKFSIYITNGENSNENQISDINDTLLPMNIELLMCSPNEEEALSPTISEVYKKGIPVILIDRKTTDTNYTCFIGASNLLIGNKVADYAAHHGKKGDKILEVHGSVGASATIDRNKGFNTRLNEEYADMEFQHIGDLYCNFSKNEAKEAMTKYLKDNEVPDIIYAHNDDMAIGISYALEEANIKLEDVIIMGVDGSGGENGGIKAVMDKRIDATFYYPDGADEAIEIAKKILAGDKNIPKNISLNTLIITYDNAEGLYSTMTWTNKQQTKIIEQSRKLQHMLSRIDSQVMIISLGSIAFLLIAIMFVRTVKVHRENKLANQALNEKNAEIIAQKEELETQTAHLNETNEQLNKSRENILGSIRVAKTIQNAVLPSEHDLNFFFNAFVIYMPKDIVSGDFYWYYSEVNSEKEIHIMGVIDCTGHGVPGAFMSLIGVNLLDQIVKQRKIFSPAQILEKLNTAVRTALRQDENDIQDGMEAILCKVERDSSNGKMMMTYEGAKFPLFHYIKSENRVEQLKSSRRQLGGKFRNIEQKTQFIDHTSEIFSGDRLYMSSDGIGDQNDINRKRYRMSRLVDKISESNEMTMAEQRNYIATDLSNFMLGCLQRDDITVLGIEV